MFLNVCKESSGYKNLILRACKEILVKIYFDDGKQSYSI